MVLPPERRVLKNGVKCSIINAGEADIVRIDLLFKGGKWTQTQRAQAALTAAMLKYGTKRYSYSKICELLDYYGAWLDMSATRDYITITLHSLTKYVRETLDVVASMILEPTFPEEEFTVLLNKTRERHKVNLSRGEYVSIMRLLNVLYGNVHPLGQQTTFADYDALSAKKLSEYHRRHFHSRNCSIFIAGKVTDETVSVVEQMFGNEPFGEQQSPIRLSTYLPDIEAGKRFFNEKPDAAQSCVRIGMHSVGYLHPDALPLKILITLFGGYFGSRLMSNIREEKGYTYGIYAMSDYGDDESMLLIAANTAHEYVEPLIGEVYHEITRLQNERVPEVELDLVKNYMIGDLLRSYENAFAIDDGWIECEMRTLPDSFFTDTFEVIKSITADRLRDLAQQYLIADEMKEVVTGRKIS